MNPRNGPSESSTDELPDGWCDVIGNGRMGRALTAALTAGGVSVRGPLGRGSDAAGASVVIVCVPDREIASAARAITPGPIVGHVSASAPLFLLAPHECFTMHPLLSVVGAGANFAGATCAVAGSSERAAAIAVALAQRLGMQPRFVPDEQRALYHAAASAASNYVTAVLGLAERLAEQTGLEREAFEPLVRATVANWVARGAADALTGPVARGDEATVARQRDAVLRAAPETIALWDALVHGTRDLARARHGNER